MRLLERREMRQSGQPQQPLEFRHVADDAHHAPIVGAEKLPQGQKSEQLWLSEVLPRELRGIRGQASARSLQGHPGQRDRRTRHASLYLHRSRIGIIDRVE